MQRPKWLSGWGKGKNPLEACLLIDTADIKVVEASFNKNLLFFAVGAAQKNEMEWKIFYDSTALPPSMPIDRAKTLMAGIVSASAGSASVYNASTVYVASGSRPSKGNAPLLLDYEMAKKIEEAKRRKQAELSAGASSQDQV